MLTLKNRPAAVETGTATPSTTTEHEIETADAERHTVRGRPRSSDDIETADAHRRTALVALTARRSTIRKTLVSLLVAATASLAIVSTAVEPASAAAVRPPSIECNPYHGRVYVHSGVVGSESVGDGAYVVFLYRWTSAGWQMVDIGSGYVPASLYVLGGDGPSFQYRSGNYGAVVIQISSGVQLAPVWAGWCSMG